MPTKEMTLADAGHVVHCMILDTVKAFIKGSEDFETPTDVHITLEMEMLLQAFTDREFPSRKGVSIREDPSMLGMMATWDAKDFKLERAQLI